MTARVVEYYCKQCDIKTDLSECPNCHQRTELKSSAIFWCEHCGIPLYENHCSLCGNKAKRISSDIRPVFPEERLLMEIVLGEPLKYKDSSVWSSASNYYLIDGGIFHYFPELPAVFEGYDAAYTDEKAHIQVLSCYLHGIRKAVYVTADILCLHGFRIVHDDILLKFYFE